MVFKFVNTGIPIYKLSTTSRIQDYQLSSSASDIQLMILEESPFLLGRQYTRFLCRKGRNEIHKRRRQAIVGFKALLFHARPHLIHPLWIEALFNDGRHESRELRFLPSLLIRQLNVNEIQAFERMVLFDSAVQVYAAVLTRVALDRRGFVDDG